MKHNIYICRISFTDFTDDDLQDLINDIDSVIDKKPQGTEMKEPESEQPEASDTKLGSDQISTNRWVLRACVLYDKKMYNA